VGADSTHASPGDMKNYVVTIDYVEEITGFDLYYNLPDEIEREIERTSSFNDWK
jgi:endonuclease G